MLSKIVAALADYTVVLEPDEDTPEWWAGAPSVTRGPDGTFFMATRMREGLSPKGQRGYEIRVLKSADGVKFEPIAHLRREEAKVPGFERPALLWDSVRGKYLLYCCTSSDKGWFIIRFDDAETPEAFDASTARTVLQAEPEEDDTIQILGYKDPVVLRIQGEWHMFVIGHDRVERTYHFVSQDGNTWSSVGGLPIFENRGWHNMYTRPASILPMSVGYLFVYEGSALGWYDPNYNICTGLAYTPDLEDFHDLTPKAPLLVSTTPGELHNTWRYSHWMRVGDEIFVYFEAARPNRTNEVRLGRFSATEVMGTL